MTLTTTQFIIICAAILFIIILFIFPSFRKQLKSLMGGFLQLFIQDKAKTPEGARAIYTQAIEERREDYKEICNAVDDFAGKYKSLTDEHNKNKKIAENADRNARTAMSKNDLESARTWAQTRQEALDMCNNIEPYIEKTKKSLEEARKIKEQIGNELAKLERESKNVVTQMELNEQMADSYSRMDELRVDTATEKLLKATREGAKEKEARAAGAKMNYQTSREGKQAAAKAKASDYDIEAYLNSIKSNTTINKKN